MKKKIFLSLLVLYGIFLQISESLLKENLDKLSDLHIRKKRIIDTSENRDEGVLRQEVPYVVSLLKINRILQCTGIILKPRIILTAAHCVFEIKVLVVSGDRINTTTKIHNVVVVIIHQHFNVQSRKNDLALLVINEPIDLIHSFHRPIELHEGHLPANSVGLVTGWGCTTRSNPETPSQPLSILVPILTQQQCQNALGSRATISPQEICTHYINRTKSCWYGDSGGPLVVNGHLVGLFSWFIILPEREFPDVYMNLLDAEYKTWIRRWIDHLQHHPHN